MSRESIQTNQAPAAIGPYSQAIKIGTFIYTSGQIPLDKEGRLIGEDIAEQTTQCLINAGKILEAAGSSLGKVVKTTVFLDDMENFTAMNQVYASFFNAPYPARSCVEVSRLPKGVKVEIEMIASI
ncbi:MAG: RidA family protein [Syntrophomonadaceae bacterium]|jgi:2-iminobutanoate/2-iminopropanoate deaminase|nr:RidA family protein [Syntrophomonadaceae bacterium]